MLRTNTHVKLLSFVKCHLYKNNLKMCDIFSSKSAKRKLKCKEGEVPPKKIVSEGDLLIKQLSRKQLTKNTTLKRELSTNQQFQRSTQYSSLSNLTAGTSKCSDFELAVEKCKEIDFLKSKGLSNFDLQLYADFKDCRSFNELLKTKYKNIEETVLNEKIQSILKVIENDDSKTLSDNDNCKISRHDIDYLHSIKPNSVENRLLKFAINNQSKKQLIKKDIDHINDVEKEFVQNLQTFESIDPKQIQKRARKLQKQIDKLDKEGSSLVLNKKSEVVLSNSQWDVKEVPDIKEKVQSQIKEQKVYQCKEQNFYTIKNGQIVKLEQNEKPFCLSTDSSNLQKLNIDEIKAISRFNNYEPGLPTNNLYLKNLSNKITKDDLSSVFKKYRQEINGINLLKGKLRGQAFIKFSNTEVATSALEEINGTVLKSKPIIIQFGKKAST